MKVILVIFIAFLFIPQIGFSCVCDNLDTKDVSKTIKLYQYAIIGTPIEVISDLESDEQVSSSGGLNVKVRIDSILNGSLNSKYIMVNQFMNDNCVQFLKLGDQYIILGDKINRFVNKTEDYLEEKGIIPSTEIPPPPPGLGSLHNGFLNCYNLTTLRIDFWNKLAGNELVIRAN